MLLKYHEWDIMSDVSTVLKDFSNVTTYISTEQHISTSQIYPIVSGLLKKSLNASGTDNSVVRKVKSSLGDEIIRWFKLTPFSLYHKITTKKNVCDLWVQRGWLIDCLCLIFVCLVFNKTSANCCVLNYFKWVTYLKKSINVNNDVIGNDLILKTTSKCAVNIIHEKKPIHMHSQKHRNIFNKRIKRIFKTWIISWLVWL